MQQQAITDPMVEAREPESATPSPKTPSVPLLIRYLQEIGKTDLLTREDEERLSREFGAARETLVQKFKTLPASVRAFVVGETEIDRKTADWTFAELDRCCERLTTIGRGSSDFQIAKVRREVKRAKAQLDRSREEMVRANLKLVTHVAKEYSRTKAPDLDLIQEGNLGLLRAVEKYEHERGFRFSTYAYWWIRQAIGRALSDRSRTIRLPVHLGRRMRKVQKAAMALTEELGRDPTQAELAAETELPKSSIEEVFRVAYGF